MDSDTFLYIFQNHSTLLQGSIALPNDIVVTYVGHIGNNKNSFSYAGEEGASATITCNPDQEKGGCHGQAGLGIRSFALCSFALCSFALCSFAFHSFPLRSFALRSSLFRSSLFALSLFAVIALNKRVT